MSQGNQTLELGVLIYWLIWEFSQPKYVSPPRQIRPSASCRSNQHLPLHPPVQKQRWATVSWYQVKCVVAAILKRPDAKVEIDATYRISSFNTPSFLCSSLCIWSHLRARNAEERKDKSVYHIVKKWVLQHHQLLNAQYQHCQRCVGLCCCG